MEPGCTLFPAAQSGWNIYCTESCSQCLAPVSDSVFCLVSTTSTTRFGPKNTTRNLDLIHRLSIDEPFMKTMKISKSGGLHRVSSFLKRFIAPLNFQKFSLEKVSEMINATCQVSLTIKLCSPCIGRFYHWSYCHHHKHVADATSCLSLEFGCP